MTPVYDLNRICGPLDKIASLGRTPETRASVSVYEGIQMAGLRTKRTFPPTRTTTAFHKTPDVVLLYIWQTVMILERP